MSSRIFAFAALMAVVVAGAATAQPSSTADGPPAGQSSQTPPASGSGTTGETAGGSAASGSTATDAATSGSSRDGRARTGSAASRGAGRDADQSGPTAGGSATGSSANDGASAEPRPGRRMQTLAVRVTGEPPAIDGVLDDAVWSGAPLATDFTQMRPAPGQPASERTEARIAYDDRYVYVAMRMYDADPDGIADQLARRDASGINADWAHVLIDSQNDRRTAFRFSATPRGVQKDVFHFDDSSEDLNWDAIWQVATARDSLGWTAEFRIPLSQLRYGSDPEDERVWGVNFGREIARRGEWSWWSPTLPTVGGMVSQAGELRGLDRIVATRRLELLPYTVGRVMRAPGDAANPFYRSSDPGFDAGADLRYGVTSSLTLSATLNPDFGQVEADPSQVNLTAAETFFAEKRPFFVEGANIFSYRIGLDDNSGETLFYSRRIGRAPQRVIEPGDGWVDAPQASRILGAAKLSGRTSDGWTLGFLSAVTAPEYARVAGPGMGIAKEPVEPLATYGVASLARDFNQGRTSVGLLGTGVRRELGDHGSFDFLRSSAYSGSVRGRHLFADRTWEANAYFAGSHIRGGPDAIARVQRGPGRYFQRPDADHLDFDPTRTSLSGALANVGLFKNAGSKIRGGLGAQYRSPGLELNDIGFQNDADQVVSFISARYQQYEPHWIFRNWTVGINPSIALTTGGERTWSQIGHFANFELRNFWSGGWWTGRRFSSLNTGALRGGPAIVTPAGQRWQAWLNTDRRRPVSASLSTHGGVEFDGGGWDYGVNTGLTFRPTAGLNLNLGPSLNRNSHPWHYVAEREAGGLPHYVLGHLDQTTLSVTTRVDYTHSPTLSFQFYAQPFVSAARYADFREVRDPRATRFDDRFMIYTGGQIAFDPQENRYLIDRAGDGQTDFNFRNPDFNFRQLRSNAVMRWEYRPGSTFFLVWSQGRTGRIQDGSFDLTRDLDGLLGAPATNVLLLKLSYWFDL